LAVTIDAVEYPGLVNFVQSHFTDGLVLVIGSGLSAAEGIPGMVPLAEHLSANSHSLTGGDAWRWAKITKEIDEGEGLEAALLKNAPSETLEEWIVAETCNCLLPKEREVMIDVLRGDRSLRLTDFLTKIRIPASGLPILTPNYDRLIELACEMAGLHVDTTAIGHYAGAFDPDRSCMASCKRLIKRAKAHVLEHHPRAVVLKPHGSFDWYRTADGPRRCIIDLEVERLIITPGLNKYRAGYSSPFDKHRELANAHINRAARLLIVGYGFNDDHLQTHLVDRIRSGTPTLILGLAASTMSVELSQSAPSCVSVAKIDNGDGITAVTKTGRLDHPGHNLWDLAVLTKELLA